MNVRPRSSATRRLVSSLALLAAASLWIWSFDDESMPPYALLGGYTHLWFAFNAAVSYLAFWGLVWAWSPPSRNGFLAVLSAHLGVLGLFVVLELASILGGVSFDRLLPSPMQWEAEGTEVWALPNQRIEGEAPTDLSYVFGIDVPTHPFAFQTDRFGLRNPLEKREPRVFFLGDSILVAGLVPVERTVTERVEAALGVSILNVSKFGYAPQAALSRLEETELDVGASLVVHFIFEGNDLLDSGRWRRENEAPADAPWRGTPRAAEAVPWPDRGLAKSLMNLTLRHKRDLPEQRKGSCPGSDLEDDSVYFFYDGPSIDEELPELEHLAELFARARDHFGGMGTRYALVFVPTKISALHAACDIRKDSAIGDARHARSAFGARLAEAAAQEGIPFLDATQGLRVLAESGTLPYFAADTHLNARGHEELARQVAPFVASLRDNAPDPQGARTGGVAP